MQTKYSKAAVNRNVHKVTLNTVYL